MLQGYTVSDLHLFSNRSLANRHLAAIEKAADQADLFILNGDIFDFQWSHIEPQAEILAMARNWIEALVLPRPKCQFVFLVGNHDAVPEYLETLEALSNQHLNLNWREHTFELGDKLFLHGDALHSGPTLAGLAAYRDSCNRKSYTPTRRFLYETFTHSGLAAIAHKLVTSRSATSRVLRYLKTSHPANLARTKHIYFGHTHNALSAYQYAGFTFHNCGGPFTNMAFSILPFRFDANELSSSLAND